MNATDHGYAARMEGKGLRSNPHARGSLEFRQWGNGWRGADKNYDERKVITPMDVFLRRKCA